MGSLDQILELWLPTKQSRAIAVSCISLGLLAIGLPEFLQKFGAKFQAQEILLIRTTAPLTIWLIGSLSVLVLMRRDLTKAAKNIALLKAEIGTQKIALKDSESQLQALRIELEECRRSPRLIFNRPCED